MESVNPKFALTHSITVCTRTNNVISSRPEVSTEAVALVIEKSSVQETLNL